MINRTRSLEINATPEALWDILGRYMHIDEFAPFVKSVDALTDGEDGVGSIRRNNFENGTTMVEEVIEWQPHRSLRVKGSEFGSLPFREVIATVSLSPLGKSRSNAVWTLDFRVKYGPFGWLLGQLVMKRSMGTFLDANLKGLADKARANQTATA